MKSSPSLSPYDVSMLACAVLLIAAVYLLASRITYAIGFPLDDSWIHQTYARSLATRGEWAFRPGVVSAGSTSPLWSVLLSLGFIIGLSPYIWTYLLGGLTLLALGCICEFGAGRILPAYHPRFPWIGLFFILEWHLVWAAMSGMETLLHALLMTMVLILLMMNSRLYLPLGLLAGLSVWVRPDGLTLIGPVLMTIVLTEPDFSSRAKAAIRFMIGFGAVVGPYLLFNLSIGGTPLPNTFYAKQAEYASWQASSVFVRIGQLLLQLLVGPGLVLLPGAGARLASAIRHRDWGSLAAMTWCAGYLWLYVSRLPAYQHGRYIMPAMPIFFLLGLLGLTEFTNSNSFNRYHWFIQTLWQVGLGAMTLLFVILGVRSYAQDVAVIESEMVATAKWTAESLPADAIIAAHDIGALGYFDQHEIIDLAGLISPQVIPFIRDEEQLAGFLNQRGADYLIAFPDFYPALSESAEAVYVSKGSFAPAFGEQNLTVFRWNAP